MEIDISELELAWLMLGIPLIRLGLRARMRDPSKLMLA